MLARQMLQRAIDLDPRFAAAYALLSLAHSQDWTQGWSLSPQALEHAFELAQKAIALDETLSAQKQAREGHRCAAEGYRFQPQ